MTFTLDEFRRSFQGSLNDKVIIALTFVLWVVVCTHIVYVLRTSFYPANESLHWIELTLGVIVSVAAFSVRFKRT